jgi:hypothetical protein
MKFYYPPVVLLALLFLFVGCAKEDVQPNTDQTISETFLENDFESDLNFRSPVDLCSPLLRNLFDPAGTYVPGGIRYGNGDTELLVNFVVTPGWTITSTRLYVGDCATIPPDQNGDPDVNAFPYQSDTPNGVRSYDHIIPLAGLPSCYCIVAYATMENTSTGAVVNKYVLGDIPAGPGYAINYCTDPCGQTSCTLGHRTQTQGGWGSPPNGGNPGAYLHANFAGAFPAGLQVGCNFTITLTSAQAVTDFLPQGGPPSALTQNYVDPGSGNISVLAGQVTALALSVGFDAFDPNFGVSAFPLADLELASGTFAGWTVAEVLAEGEAILGGCASQYTASQINDALSTINQNFVDGTTDNGDLVCP